MLSPRGTRRLFSCWAAYVLNYSKLLKLHAERRISNRIRSNRIFKHRVPQALNEDK